MNRKIIIGGGGTGGNVYPAISIANAIKSFELNIEILFVGAEGKLEMEKVPEAGYPVIGLPVIGFPRKIGFKYFTFFYKLFKSTIKSQKIIKQFRPDLVVGVGGYASGPIVKAAIKYGIPIVLQEQNSFAGFTNRILAPKAQKIFVAYEGMEKYFPLNKIMLTGNPVRKDILSCFGKREEGLNHFKLSDKYPVVLILGGSLGSGNINKTLMKASGKLPDDIQFLWQTGKNYFLDCIMVVEREGRKNIVVLPFIREMELAYGCADLIVSRAGAGTISELAVVGKPVILVPSPNVAEDHQTRNAMALTRKNAALMIKDDETDEKLIDTINKVISDKLLRTRLSENIKKLAITDAAEKIAEEILKNFKH